MHLVQELERTRDETLKCFSLNRGDLARTYAPGKWSVGYILHHLSDSETVFFDRIRRVLSEPRQVLWVMDQDARSEEHTSELQSRLHLVCRLLLEKKKK